MTPVQIKLLHPRAVTPTYATDGSGAFDIRAIDAGFAHPGTVTKIPLGIAVAIPPGTALLITSRSGHGAKHGAGVPHGYGLIDSDYRGELFMVMRTERTFAWEAGERICQAMLVPALRAAFELVLDLPETARGVGGFGSTGRT